MPFDIIKIRRDTFTNWQSANPTLALGEISYDRTNNQIRIGNGTLPWLDLPVIGNAAITNGDKGDIVVTNNGATWSLDTAILTLINNKIDQGPLDGGTASAGDQVLQVRRATTVEWANSTTILAVGEMGYDTTLKEIRVGNGQDTWVNLDPVGVNKAGSTYIQMLADVDYPNTSPANGEVLTFNGSTSTWVNLPIPAVNIGLNDLNNVTLSSPQNTQILQFNGTEWVNAPAPTSTGGGVTTGLKNQINVVNATNDWRIVDNTITQDKLNLSLPVNQNDAATKDYVDQTVGLGITFAVTEQLGQPFGIADLDANAKLSLSDLAQGGATTNQILKWSGTSWIPSTTSGGAVSFDDLTDVEFTTLAANDILIFDTVASKWKNAFPSVLSGLHSHTLSSNTLPTPQKVSGRLIWWNNDLEQVRTTTLTGGGLATISHDNTANTITVTVPTSHTHASTDITGLGTMATQNANNVTITGGTLQGTSVVTGTYSTPSNQAVMKQVRNNSGSPIAKGKVVRITGSLGDNLTISLSDATDESTSAGTIGITAEDISNGSDGYIITQGVLSNLSGITAPLVNGDLLWLSETAGEFTKTRPTAPAHGVVVGWVMSTSAGSAGRIYVKIDNGYELNELHNVLISSVAPNDLLVWDSSSQLWKNKSLSTVGIQPLDATLTALAGVTTTTNNLIYATGSDTFQSTPFTAFARSLVDKETAADVRSLLALGSLATLSTVTNSQINNNSISVAKLSTSGTASAQTYLRGDSQWVTIPQSIGTGISLLLRNPDDIPVGNTTAQALGNLTTGLLKNTTVDSGFGPIGTLSIATATDLPSHTNTHDLEFLGDVSFPSGEAQNKDVLQYNNLLGKWTNVPLAQLTLNIGDIANLQTSLDNKASAAHSHSISSVNGLQTALDGKLDNNKTTAFTLALLEDQDAVAARATLELGSIATVNAIGTNELLNSSVTIQKISATGTPSATSFLRGDGSWAAQGSITDGGNF